MNSDTPCTRGPGTVATAVATEANCMRGINQAQIHKPTTNIKAEMFSLLHTFFLILNSKQKREK